jgi:hypothetical protein
MPTLNDHEMAPYFIMLRFVNTGWIGPVTNSDEGDSAATSPTHDAAQKWIDNSAIVQSGQVAANIYEVP